MKIEIRKTDELYEEFLVWMAYRYAIGLTSATNDRGRNLMERYEVFRDIQYDTPEFHQLAAEIVGYLRRKKMKDVVDLQMKSAEANMMWYASHYACGSHSYAGSLCHDIVRWGRFALSDRRKEFLAFDIRREISERLSWRPFNFRMPIESERRHKPLDLLINFFVLEGIKCDEDLAGYKEVEVYFGDDGTPLYHVEKTEKNEENHRPYFFNEIHDYICWEDMASYFDPKLHKRCRVVFEGKEEIVEYFDAWAMDQDEPGRYSFRKIKRLVKEYAMNPHRCCYINEDYIVEDNM